MPQVKENIVAFITNFNIALLPLYQKAVRTFPDGKDFSASKRDCWKRSNSGFGSLHYFGNYYGPNLTLGPFWEHYDKLREEFDKLVTEGATNEQLLAWSNEG